MRSLYSLYLEARMPKDLWQEMESLYSELYDLAENGRYVMIVRVMVNSSSTAAQDYNLKKRTLMNPDQVERIPSWEEVLQAYPVPQGWRKVSRKEELVYMGYSSESRAGRDDLADDLAEKLRSHFPLFSVWEERYRVNPPEINLGDWQVTIKTTPDHFSQELKGVAKKYPSWDYKRGIFSRKLS